MIYCAFCTVQLSFPNDSTFIQCPKCEHTMNPQAPQQSSCIACHTVLSHPPDSLYIQCPKCFTTMNIRDARAQTHAQAHATVSTPMHSFDTEQTCKLILVDSYSSAKPQKKKRDPNAPKAASNAYMIFCKENRPKLKEEHPELPFGRLGAKLGEVWRALSPEEKKPYEDRAADDRERYRKEMESYASFRM